MKGTFNYMNERPARKGEEVNKRIAIILFVLLGAMGAAAVASAVGPAKTVTRACFGVQLHPPLGAGNSRGDVNIYAKPDRVCIIGRRGPKGANGANGKAGPAGVPGPTGRQGVRGATGATGPQGAAGAQGPQGVPGPQGPAGKNGLGNAIGYLCVSNGNSVKWGGFDGSLCNRGHDTLVKIAVVTP